MGSGTFLRMCTNFAVHLFTTDLSFNTGIEASSDTKAAICRPMSRSDWRNASGGGGRELASEYAGSVVRSDDTLAL